MAGSQDVTVPWNGWVVLGAVERAGCVCAGKGGWDYDERGSVEG